MKEVSVLRSSFNSRSYSTRGSYQSYFCILGFLPTIGELVQADIPQNIDGISYLPTLTGKGIQKEHDCIYYEFFEFGGKQSIMTPDGWKLVRLEVSDPSKTYEELYNIYTDPAETTNVIKQYPDVARKLKNMIGGQRVENARFHF